MTVDPEVVANPSVRRGVKRRTLIAAAGLGVLARLLQNDLPTSDEETFAHTRDQINTHPPRDVAWVMPHISADQLAITTNQRLATWPDRSVSAAISITHPGYREAVSRALYNGMQRPRDAKRLWETSSDVCRAFARLATHQGDQLAAHTANTARLLAALPGLADAYPAVVYLEREVQGGEARLPIDMVPPQGVMTIGTETASGQPVETVSTPDLPSPGVARQQPELVFNRLREAGVTTVFAAGEFAYNPDASAACLGVTTQAWLEAGFNVRGIAGAVFPVEPPLVNADKAMFKALYDNQIPLGELIG